MTLTKKALQFVGLATIALSFTAFAASDQDSVAERIEPVGKVCMAGDECSTTQLASADTGPRSGQAVYEKNCVACHSTGVAGAPTLGDAAAWESRIADGMDEVYDNAWNGLNAMPPKGLCMDCTREELNAAVDYLVESSQ